MRLLSKIKRRWHLSHFPVPGQYVYYHSNLVLVTAVSDDSYDLRVRWYDDDDRHEEWVSWLHCCRRV